MCGTDNFGLQYPSDAGRKGKLLVFIFFPLPKLRHLGYKGIASAACIFQYMIKTANKI